MRRNVRPALLKELLEEGGVHGLRSLLHCVISSAVFLAELHEVHDGHLLAVGLGPILQLLQKLNFVVLLQHLSRALHLQSTLAP